VKLHYRYVSYSPSRTAIDQVQQMHRLMHQMAARAGSSGAWQPAADLYETETTLVVQVELAGVREEDIEITLFADHLSISGRRQNRTPTNAVYSLAGIFYGDFNIVVPIGTGVRRDAVEATFEDGLLGIVLPKAIERIEPVNVQLSAAGRQPLDGNDESKRTQDTLSGNESASLA